MEQMELQGYQVGVGDIRRGIEVEVGGGKELGTNCYG
jgi:hypothetical protein